MADKNAQESTKHASGGQDQKKSAYVPDPKAKEWYTKAGAAFEENKFDESIDCYSKAIEIDPNYSSAYFNRALSYAIVNKYEEAERDAETVMDIEPDSYDAPYVMGIVAEYQQDFQGAKEWYERSLAKNPKYEQAKARLEQLKSKMNKPGTAGGGGAEALAGASPTETQMVEGQIKQVKWHKSNITFKDIVGMVKEKQIMYENIILAIKKPELLKAYGKKLGLGVLFYGPPGCGKCVSADTRVLLPDGRYETIKEVVEKKEPAILTLTQDHSLAVSKVTGHWKLNGKPLLRITTSSGRILHCTPEHPLLVMDRWVSASELSEGEEIGVPHALPVFGNLKMEEWEVKLLAYLIGDVVPAHTLPLSESIDPAVMEDFESAMLHFGRPMQVSSHADDGTVMIQHSGPGSTQEGMESAIRPFIKAHGLELADPHWMAMPKEIYMLPERLLSLFLNRLFTGDRCRVYNRKGTTKKISYFTPSESLAKDLQHLLLRFGVLSCISGNIRDGWHITVRNKRNIAAFTDKIGIFGRKAGSLKKKYIMDIGTGGGMHVVTHERIVNIEPLPAPEYVYDLTVDETHNFVANDFFVHNTYFVNAIGGETNSNVLIARINEIVDMYAGNTEKNMHAIFEQARKATPCVVFFDEVDALGVKRGGGGGDGGGDGGQNYMRMAVNQFLQEMDGVEKNPEGLFIIGATNQPWDMDPALKRSGRFGESIYLPPPDYKTRKAAFIYNTRKMPLGHINFGRLARATMGFSQADIAEISDKTALIPAAEEDRTGKKRKILMKDFIRMIKKHGGTLDEWYAMVRKDVVSKRETQIVDGKKQEIVKEGKLSPEEKARYKPLIKDVKKNSAKWYLVIKKIIRKMAIYLF